VGMESVAEFLDMETDPFIDLLQVTKALNSALPDGVRVLEARIIPKKARSLSGSIGRYRYEVNVPADRTANFEERIIVFLERDAVIVEKDGKQKDIRPGIEAIAVKGPALLEITIQDSEIAKPRIQDVIEKLFDIGHDQAVLFNIKRTAMFLKENGSWQSPIDVT
jgi:radical SAM-linked protein